MRHSVPSWRRRSRRPRPAGASSASTAASPSSCRRTRSASCWRSPTWRRSSPTSCNNRRPTRAPTFIGAPTIWDQTGGQALAGQGVIFGDLDTGLWPEHPSFADNAGLGAPPPKADGTPRVCDFGDNPLTPAVDVFACNNKLIGGQPFIDTYNAIFGGEVYPDSARDSNGHGTHTTSTPPATIVDSRTDLRHRPRPDQRRRTGRVGHRVQGVRSRGLLPVRLGRRRRAGDPRRRRRDQLLDRRRLQPVHRRRRAGVPRRLRGRRPRRRVGRQLRARRRPRRITMVHG